MTLTAHLNAIDRDRRRVESSAKRKALSVFQRARRHATAAVLLGHDPESAARVALQPLAASLAQSLMLAKLSGLRRTQLSLQRATGERVSFGGVLLSREEDEKKDRRFLAFLLLLLGMSDQQGEAIRSEMRGYADRLVTRMYGPLGEQLRGIRRVAKPDGKIGFTVEHKPGVILPTPAHAVNDLFLYTGTAPSNPYQVDRWIESGVIRQYEAGRADGGRIVSGVTDALWGYRYSAVLDSRTTRLCRTLDGWIAPKDEPALVTFRPPNHFHCRSALVEVWRSSALREPKRKDPQASPDDWAEFLRMKRTFEGYQ